MHRLGPGFNPCCSARSAPALAINNATVTDTDLRRAICYAIDRNVLLNNVYAGMGRPQTTLALPEGWAYNPDVPGFSYDPERAIEILEAAGYVDTNGDGIREKDGVPLNLDFQARGDGEWLLATQVMQQFLGDVGIGTTITASDRDTYYANIRTGAYDLGCWLSTSDRPSLVCSTAGLLERRSSTVRKSRLVTLGRPLRPGSARRRLPRVAADLLRRAIQCQQFWVSRLVLSPDLEGVVTSRGALLCHSGASVSDRLTGRRCHAAPIPGSA